MPVMNFAKRLVWRALDSFPLAQLVHAFDLVSYNRLGRRGVLDQAFEFACVNQVRGDYFEFGVWRGTTFSFAHRLKRKMSMKTMKMWAFDSFEGLPPIDDNRFNVFSQGEYACSEAEFRSILRRNGVRGDEYEVVKGFYQDSLNADLHGRMSGISAAIVWIDCDLYVSTRPVLEFLSRYLTEGTVICFDDFYFYRGSPEQGEQRAIREFLAEHPDVHFTPYLDFAPTGKSFLVHLTGARQEAFGQ
jgi:hypothetical protein